jgi:hypothetical protein
MDKKIQPSKTAQEMKISKGGMTANQGKDAVIGNNMPATKK